MEKYPRDVRGYFEFCKMKNLGGVNLYTGAWHAFAGEMILFGFDEGDLAVDGGMDGKIAAHESAWAGNFGGASLADENFASFDLLAAETLNA